MPVFVPAFFWKTLIGQKWCIPFFHNLNRAPKNLWNHYFSAGIWFFVASNINQLLQKQKKTKNTNWAHWWFLVHKKVLFQELIGGVTQTTIFCRFLSFFLLDFVTLSFCLLAFSLFFLFRACFTSSCCYCACYYCSCGCCFCYCFCCLGCYCCFLLLSSLLLLLLLLSLLLLSLLFLL